MGLFNPPPSVLTHGGDSEKAILATVKAHGDHHHKTHSTIAAKGTGPADIGLARHMHYEEPAAVAVEVMPEVASIDEVETEDEVEEPQPVRRRGRK